jgi:hypothetical protein
MYPADWIWQQYGLCLGWRCSQCKEKVLARSLPFKGLRKRKPDPDEVQDRSKAEGQEPMHQPQASGGKQKGEAGRQGPGSEKRGAAKRDYTSGV